MTLSKKQRLERALYKWIDTVDLVEDDIESFIEGHNISKLQIANNVNKMKNKLKYLEILIKNY